MRKYLLYPVPLFVTVIIVGGLLVFPFMGSDTIRATKAREYVRSIKTVCGGVKSSYYAEDEKGQPTFLNLGGEYPNHVLTVVIWGQDRPKFKLPEILYQERRICVTGKVGLFRDKPQIAVSEPEQIQVVTPMFLDSGNLWSLVFGTVVTGALQFLLQVCLARQGPESPQVGVGGPATRRRPRGAAKSRSSDSVPAPRAGFAVLGRIWHSSWRMLAVGLAGGVLAWLTTLLL